MKRNALLIGGFVVAAFALAIAAILWLGGNDLFTRQQKALVYYQGNVSGLSVGAPVTFRGVTIGQVTDIGIQMDAASLKTTVPVTLRLQPTALHLTHLTGNKAPDLPELVHQLDVHRVDWDNQRAELGVWVAPALRGVAPLTGERAS